MEAGPGGGGPPPHPESGCEAECGLRSGPAGGEAAGNSGRLARPRAFASRSSRPGPRNVRALSLWIPLPSLAAGPGRGRGARGVLGSRAAVSAPGRAARGRPREGLRSPPDGELTPFWRSPRDVLPVGPRGGDACVASPQFPGCPRAARGPEVEKVHSWHLLNATRFLSARGPCRSHFTDRQIEARVSFLS